MIDFSSYKDLATADIGAFSPKATSIEGDQVEASRTFFRSEDGSLEIGNPPGSLLGTEDICTTSPAAIRLHGVCRLTFGRLQILAFRFTFLMATSFFRSQPELWIGRHAINFDFLVEPCGKGDTSTKKKNGSTPMTPAKFQPCRAELKA